MLCLIERFPAFADLKSEISDLKFKAESISRQLRAWAESLQNSKITGHRYLNEGARRSALAARDRQEFLKELEEIRTPGDANKNKSS